MRRSADHREARADVPAAAAGLLGRWRGRRSFPATRLRPPATGAPAPAPAPAPASETVVGAEALLSDRLHALLEIARRLTQTLDRQETFRTIVDETNRALASDATAILVRRGSRLELVAWAGLSDEIVAALPEFGPDEPWFTEVVRTSRPLVRDDLLVEGFPGYAPLEGVTEFRSVVLVPLVRDREIIGVLASVNRDARRWTPAEVEFVTVLGTHASIAVGNADLFARTRTRAAQLAVLQAASARMSRAGSVESVGRAIVEETRRVLEYHNARVYLLEASSLVPIAFEGRVGAYEKVDLELLRCRLGEGFTGWVAEHGTPLLVDDANADSRGQTIEGTEDVDESMLVVPLRYDEAVTGVITLSKLGLRQFGEDDLQLLTILADQAATALESARLLARGDELTRELRRLLDMSSELSRSLDPRQVADLIAKHIAAAMGVDETAISYFDREANRVLTMGYFPASRIEELEPYFDIGGYPETLRVLRDQVAVVVDADHPDADPDEVVLLARDGFRTLAMFPLVAKGESIGLVELLSKSPVRFDDARLALARTMANEAAMALENARLYADARNLADRDPLTGFYNHRYLHQRLGAEVVRAQRSRRPLSVLMLDLDDFKLVNDTFGHVFGDRVLVWTAERIRATLRASDVAARYGGDEFAILLPETDPEAARQAARRILEALASYPLVDADHGPVPVAASVGVATAPNDGRTATELIAVADRALYRVKRAGGHDVAGEPDGAPGGDDARGASAA